MKQKATIEGWVARDKKRPDDKTIVLLGFYSHKPRKWKSQWCCTDGYCYALPDFSFPSVKWEDAEPTKCKLTIEI